MADRDRDDRERDREVADAFTRHVHLPRGPERELAPAGLIEAWVSPAILEEYADVLGDHPEFVAEIVESLPVCYPLTELSVIRHEPDNRFLDCALAADAEFIVTVNTAPGHFDRKQYQSVNVARPANF